MALAQDSLTAITGWRRKRAAEAQHAGGVGTAGIVGAVRFWRLALTARRLATSIGKKRIVVLW